MDNNLEFKLNPTEKRRTISLNGIWDVYGTSPSTTIQDLPKDFGNRVPVPGLTDLADTPIYSGAIWYKKRFSLNGKLPENAVLKINKAWWGKSVYLNGYHIQDHQPNFTPAVIDLRRRIHTGENTLLVRLGDYNSQTAAQGHVVGADYEKFEYTPGIYDDVSLILCGNPMIKYAQIAPDVANGTVTVQLTLENTGKTPVTDTPRAEIRSAHDGTHALTVAFDSVTIDRESTVVIQSTVPFSDAHLWTPEDPYLYIAAIETAGDSLSVRFGMRSFCFDPKTKLPMLNGKVYYWRGSNITMYRFFEDPNRGLLPWDRAWAKKVLLSIKRTNMNSIRYCIGFPPELWYDLADELGLLIQDEYPIWGEVDVIHDGTVPHWKDRAPDVVRTLLPELADWQRERMNHPCVVLWDMQNETDTDKTEILIKQLRDMKLDLQDRPFDNGWGRPARPTDTLECHPYLFVHPEMTWNKANRCNRDPAAKTPQFFNYIHSTDVSLLPANPRVTNEYCWLWLNRDHSPTTLTKEVYHNLIPNATDEERRLYHDKAIAKLTEFWRSSRTSAAVMYFCGLTYCKLDVGRTCDEFVGDIAEPTCTPTYVKYMGDAMAPLGICIDDISDRYAPGKRQLDVVLANDLEDAWTGEIQLELQIEGRESASWSFPMSVPAYGRSVHPIEITVPDEEGITGTLRASYLDSKGERISSFRDFIVSRETLDDGGSIKINA